MAKVVVDANVLISFVFGGLPLKTINLVMSKYRIFYSEDIEKELKGVLQKLEVKLEDNQRRLPVQRGQYWKRSLKCDKK